MKNWKKVLVMVLSICMIAGLAACGGGNTNGDETQLKPGDEGFSIAKEDLKVGVVHIGNPSDGAGYTYAHDLGIVGMQENLGLSDDQIVRKNNISDADASATETAIRELIEDGCNVIFATSYGYMDVVEAMAEEFPQVVFFHCSGYKKNDTNFTNYFGRIYQARYLTGIVAGMQTETNKIGYVMAFDGMAETVGGCDAFALGVASVNPDAKVYVQVTNTWFDLTKERQAAEALLDIGCDVIAQHQDTTAPQQAAQDRGVWGIGYNSDMSVETPEANLTSALWHWDVYYTYAVQSLIDGTFTTDIYYTGMETGLVGIADLTDNVKPGVAEKVEEAKQGLLDGTIKVFEGEIIDNTGEVRLKEGEVLSDTDITQNINWYVQNVEVQ